jgi:hypothetical protein
MRQKQMTIDNDEPAQLVTESQSTMFDTKLSKAADDFTKSMIERDAWKEKVIQNKKVLIAEMKRAKVNFLTLPANKRLEYKFTDAKEDVVIKDFKPKENTVKRSKFGRGYIKGHYTQDR